MYAVRDLMRTDVVTVAEGDSLEAVETLLALKAVRHLPVLRGDEVVGVITYRDVLEACVARGVQPRDVVAREVMQPDVRTVRPDTPLQHAARTMRDEKIGCLPVVDAAGAFLGIVTEGDFLRFALEVISDLDTAAGELERAQAPA